MKRETSGVKHQTSTRSWALSGVVLALLGLAFALRLWHLGGPSLWYDEAYVWWVAAELPLARLLALSVREVIPPLHSLLLRGWIPLAGASEFALRLPSALLGVVAVAAGGRLVGRLTGQRGGQLAALALLAVATPLLWAAREVRMYGPLLAWTLLSGVALVETLRPVAGRPRPVWPWLWAVATLAALYTLVLTGFWLMGQGVFALLVLARREGSARRRWLCALFPPALTVGALYVPWLVAAVRAVGSNAGYWRGYLPPAAFLTVAFQGITLAGFLPPALAQGAAGLILLAAALALLYTWRRPWAGLYALCYAVPLAPMALLFREIPKWGTRHASLFAPAPFLALAAGWGALGWLRPTYRRGGYFLLGLATALTLGFTLTADAYLLADPAFAHDDWRGVARYVQAHRRPGDVVIVETGSVFPAWLYYAGGEGLLPLPPDELLDVQHVLTYTTTAAQLNAGLRDAAGVWLVTWLEDVTDPTGLVPLLLGDLGHEEPLPAFHGVGLRRFVLERPAAFPSEPPLTARPEAELLPGLRLWGHDLPLTPQPADRPVDLRTWWTVDDPAAHEARFYSGLVELYDGAGYRWGDANGVPGGDYRPERWMPGVPVLGRFLLQPPAGTPPGHYTATLRLEGSAPFVLGTVVLTRPLTVPPLPAGLQPPQLLGTVAALALAGVGVDQPVVEPCGELAGHLFWETLAPPAEDYRVAVSVGTTAVTLPLALEFPPTAWEAGDRFDTRFRLPISCRAVAMTAPLTVQLLQADGTPTAATWRGPEVTVRAERTFTVPAGLTPLTADFGPGFAALVGYRLEPSALRAGESFTVTLAWRAGETGETPYTVFVHVAPPEAPGPLVAQHDSWPALGLRPTYTWIPGEIVADPHPLPGLPAGTYRLRIGLYTGATRLPLATTPPDDAVTIPVVVK